MSGNKLKLAEGAKVSCEAWRFDSPNEPKEDRWSYQTYGAKWRTARCEGVVRRALGKGQWEIQWSGREWRGRLDVMKTPQLRVEEEAAEEEEPPPPKKKAKEKEKAPETPRPKKETPPSQQAAAPHPSRLYMVCDTKFRGDREDSRSYRCHAGQGVEEEIS